MKRLLVAMAVLASSLAGPARAQTATPDPESSANALISDAARAYDQNQLDEALRLLAHAYELSPRPSILYNRAQVLRTKDDCVAALDAYQRFIAATTLDDPNRERAVRRRAEMQTCADQQRSAGSSAPAPSAGESSAEVSPPAPPAHEPGATRLAIATPPPPALAPPVALDPSIVTAPAAAPGQSRRRAMRITGWALIGVGVVAAGTAAAFAWEAHRIQTELQGPVPRKLSDYWPDYQEGTRDASRAQWLGAAAALAGTGGTTLLVIARPAATTGSALGSPPSRVAAAILGWSGTF